MLAGQLAERDSDANEYDGRWRTLTYAIASDVAHHSNRSTFTYHVRSITTTLKGELHHV